MTTLWTLSKYRLPSFTVVVESLEAKYEPLPRMWVRTQYTHFMPKGSVTIITSYGYEGKVMLEWDGKDLMFGEGWSKVLKDLNCEAHSILCFTVITPYTFEVTVFGRDDCEKGGPDKKDPMFIACFGDKDQQKLVIPHSWVRNQYSGRNDPQNEMWITTVRNYRGRVVMDTDGKQLWFSTGWPKIVKDLDLHLMDLLVFKPMDVKTLELMVYQPSCIERITTASLHSATYHNSLPGNSKLKVEVKVEESDEGSEGENVHSQPATVVPDTQIQVDTNATEVSVNQVKVETNDSGMSPNPIVNDEPRVYKFKIERARCLRFPNEWYALPGFTPGSSVNVVNLDRTPLVWGIISEKGKQPKYVVSKGWRPFVRINNLNVGDECFGTYNVDRRRFTLTKVKRVKRVRRQ